MLLFFTGKALFKGQITVYYIYLHRLCRKKNCMCLVFINFVLKIYKCFKGDIPNYK